MFPIGLQDCGGGHPPYDVDAWRCFACGDIVDQLIVANRHRHGPDREDYRRQGARRRANAIGLLR
ncbi:MAG TPA: hypothetical protein DCQ94_05370 [Nitrospira sp.]|nr:hypothetical protein [Nitrospira sp.]